MFNEIGKLRVMRPPSSDRSILFLQGPPSTFWRQLSEAFEQRGIATQRVNFSLGDRLYWQKPGALNYRGSISRWPDYLKALIERENVSDILYYADQLPYHRIALDVAKELGVRCHAVEFGYLRPDWITLERDGMGRHSHFPNDPAQVSAIASKVGEPDLDVKYAHTFGQEAFNEVVYNLLSFFGRPFYPLYKADKYYSALVDYLPWLWRSFGTPAILPHDFLDAGHPPLYLAALQLQSDYQIRANSPYRHLREMLEEVICSFATYAPKDSNLVFKQHPLDNGLERWGRSIRQIAREHGVEDRIVFIEQGNLNVILRQAKGVIVVNSTVGIHSLRAHKPTIALGCAIYDLAGLTHQSGLDDFWHNPAPVDLKLLGDFITALAATVQVKGNFYNNEGRRVAINEIVSRILSATVNQPDAFIEPPPRFESPKGLAKGGN